MTTIALENCVAATLSDTAYFQDLADAVANDRSVDTAARWLWTILTGAGQPLETFDRYIHCVEAVCRTWPVLRRACLIFGNDPAPIARFIAERIPAAMQETSSDWLQWTKPVTAALVIGERAHDLAGFFSCGLKPNGSKDPYALRRAAKQFIQASLLGSWSDLSPLLTAQEAQAA